MMKNLLSTTDRNGEKTISSKVKNRYGSFSNVAPMLRMTIWNDNTNNNACKQNSHYCRSFWCWLRESMFKHNGNGLNHF